MPGLRVLFAVFGEAFVLQIVAVGLIFFLHFVAARLGGPEPYGAFSYALTIASFLSVVTSLGLANTSMRFIAGYLETGQWGLLVGLLNRSGQLILSVSLIVAILLILSSLVFKENARASSILGAAVLLPVLALSFWRSAANRGFQNVRQSLLPEEVIRPLIFIVVCSLLSIFGKSDSSNVLIASYFFASICALIIGIRWLASNIALETSKAAPQYATRAWLKTSFPMLMAGIFQELLLRADLIVLGMYSSMESTGLYNAASRLSFLNVFSLRVVDSVIPPQIAAAYYSGQKSEVKRLIKRGIFFSTCGSLPVFAVMMAFPEQLLGIFGRSFVAATPYLKILAFGQFINAMTGPVGYALLMTGHEKFYRNVMASSSIASTLVYFWAIPRFGALGAAWVMCGSTIFLNLTLLVGVKKKLFTAL